MKAKILNLNGEEIGSIELPMQFKEALNPNLIKRAVLAVRSTKYQPKGVSKDAGKRASAKLSRRRRQYRGAYGHGISRVPRKIFWRRGTQFGWEGAFAPGTVGGRKAHPSKSDKILKKNINKKERRKAIRSAISATMNAELVKVNHKLPKKYPLIIDSKIESLNKTKQVVDLLKKLDLSEELKRLSVKKIRAGKGKTRGRKYKTKKGPLIVIAKDCSLQKSARNLPGINIVKVNLLNAEILAPSTLPGRLTIWSKDAIDILAKQKLFTNTPNIEE